MPPSPVRFLAPQSRDVAAELVLRPVAQGDGAALQDYVRRLSLQSRTNRFFGPLRELPPAELARAIGANDRDRLTLLLTSLQGDEETIIGEARVALSCEAREGELHRSEIGAAGIEQNHLTTHKAPLVLGIPRPSRRIAWRNARAKALKQASTM